MKILHLYSGNLYGGIETYLVTLARLRALAPEMLPEFGLCFPGRLWNELLEAGVKVHDLGSVRLSRPWTVWGARRRLDNLLRTSSPDVVLVHGCWPHVVFGPIVRRRHTKLVHMLHENLENPGWLDRKAAGCMPNLVVANSHFTAVAARRVFAPTPIEVCYLPVAPPNNISPLARNEVRKELGAGEQAVVILQASRLERWKGHRALLGALAILKENRSWELWVAGGPQRPHEARYLAELRQFCVEQGIRERVRFLGQRTDVRRLMAAADLFCQPNTSPEPFGIVLVEALFAGLPVVTTGFGGGAEIVDETCGSLIPAGRAEQLAAGLQRLIEDVSLRTTLSRQASVRAMRLCAPSQQLQLLSQAIAAA